MQVISFHEKAISSRSLKVVAVLVVLVIFL